MPNHTAQIDHVPTVAIYPNGDTTRSSAAVVVQSGSIKLNAKVYKDKNLMRPLIAAHDITSQGNNIILDKHGLTVKDQGGKTLAYSPKDPNARLWSMPSLTATSNTNSNQTRAAGKSYDSSINNITQHSVHASITSYANATMGSPPDKTMQQALDRDYFRYPGLTPQMYRKNPPHAIESSEGHMKQSRQNVRSTQTKEKMKEEPYNSDT